MALRPWTQSKGLSLAFRAGAATLHQAHRAAALWTPAHRKIGMKIHTNSLRQGLVHTNFGITPVSLQKRDTKIDTTLVRNRTKFLSAGV